MSERCPWREASELYRRYHDLEWGVPLRDDSALFELLLLEGAQAGLSWATVLRKRDNYRLAFDGFKPEMIARYDDTKIAALLSDPGIIRNRAKVTAAVQNARAYQELVSTGQSFSAFVWRFVNDMPIQNRWTKLTDIPSTTPQSEAMSKALRATGFCFVGPTICYAFMQSAGMVNDHLDSCPRHAAVAALSGFRW